MAGLSLSSSPLGPGGLPPPSPSLQPYFGTYQSISPLPSPVLSPSGGSSFYSSTSTVTTTTSTTGGGYGSDGSFSIGPSSHPSHGAQITPVIPSRPPSPPYDPSADAKELLSSLKHFRPSAAPLIQILPTLSPSQLVLLRREYKRIFRQVNIAKHIKTVFANTSFGKLAFAVALGPYESEAWFANCWYQKRETRNELLIEALMGKTNDEIRKIKDGFKDAKYENSLMQAVRNELVANKFRIAVLIQLEGMRMEEGARINLDGVREDVRRLGEVLERKDGRGGGETMMIEIVVNRSDAWIREVAALYRNTHGRDLPKAIMRHSKNLVGETLLHVINGAIDKPLRDAKLMEQALSALIESGREDLLISRCVRVHWDPYHLERVKQAYKKKFKVDLGKRMRDAVEDGNFEDFLVRMIRD
ncbi:hypothetical protein DFP73DRAFT_476391 [Morchella snyderi]|nr:hypothetical protein DFP73DRAFT_476391 [Morchella snyderi]